MNRTTTKTYVVKRYIDKDCPSIPVIDKRLDRCIDIYLAIRSYAEKGANHLMNIPEYRHLRELKNSLKKQGKKLFSEKKKLMEKYEADNNYGEFHFHWKVKEFRAFFGNSIGAHLCQKLATRAFLATERILNEEAFRLSPLKHGDEFSIDEKDRKGILHFSVPVFLYGSGRNSRHRKYYRGSHCPDFRRPGSDFLDVGLSILRNDD